MILAKGTAFINPLTKIFTMKIDYADALKSGLKFCIQPKRWLPFFITDLAFASVGLIVLLSNIDSLLYFLSGLENPVYMGPALGIFLSLIGLFAGWVLINIWINGAVIHQSLKEKEFDKSWRVSKSKYLSLLAVGVITTFISICGNIIFGAIPYAGGALTIVFSILVAIIFFFPYQSVIVKGNGFYKALEDSVKIFKRMPFTISVAWLMITVISFILALAFAIPLLALVLRTFLEASAGGTVSAAMSMIFSIQADLTMFIVAGIIFLLGMAIVRAFSLKAQTEFYLQIKKHRG